MIDLNKFELIVSDTRKQVYGEVYTDIKLISEMLIDIDSDIWSDPSESWYDPTCGKGYFLFFIYDILMGNGFKYDGYAEIEGLKNIIPDESERERHIIENMILGTDIQQDNIDFCNNLFKSDTYSTNFLCRDYLKFSTTEFKIKVKNYVGNPPFQDVMTDGKRKAKNHNLWSPIIEKSYQEMEFNCIMSFVCPSSWMSLSKSNKKMFNIIKKNQIIHINLEECNKYFKGVGSSFSYFTLIKNSTPKSCVVTCKYKSKIYKTELNIDIDCLPLLITNNSISILKKVIFGNHKKLNFKFDSYLHAFTKKSLLSTKESDKHRYKIFHTIKMIRWSEIPHNNQYFWKILIPRSTYYDKLFIDYGSGTTQSMGYLLCESEEKCKKMELILKSKLFRYIMSITRWGNWTSQDILYRLPYLDPCQDWNNDKIYRYFELTPEEVKEVEDIINN